MLKIGGFYRIKDGSWFFVNKKFSDGVISGRFIYIEPDFYDEDIVDISEKELSEKLVDGICWTGKYHRKYGLYAVWDGANKKTMVKLQNIGGDE